MSAGEAGLLVLLGAVIFLDRWPVFQTMVSRPIVVGPVVGVILGDSSAGALWGAVFETIYLGLMPVGAARVPDASLAALVGTSVAVQGRLDGVEAAVFAVAAGFAAGLLGERVDRWHRAWNGRTAERVARAVAGGDLSAPGRGIAAAIFRGAVVGALLSAVTLTLALAALEAVETTWLVGPVSKDAVRMIAVAAAAVAGARLFSSDGMQRAILGTGVVAGALAVWGAA